jgi:hypothetical protein
MKKQKSLRIIAVLVMAVIAVSVGGMNVYARRTVAIPERVSIGGDYFYTNAEYLDLRFRDLTSEDIAPLVYMQNLELLILGGNEITDISVLAGLTDLVVLSLWQNDITDISPLAGLVNLERLFIDDNRIRDISPLAGLANLEDLHLAENLIADISPLAELDNLWDLDLHDNRVTDISALAGSGVRWLNLGCNRIYDFSPLAYMTNLVVLDIHNSSFTDLSPLSGLEYLADLTISGNRITDISPLENLNLGILTANVNLINDLSVITTMPYLSRLWVSGNEITDISPIAEASRLSVAGLDGNDITDWSPADRLLMVNGRPPLPGLVVYSLSRDFFFQALDVGTRGTTRYTMYVPGMGWNPFIMDAGSPTFEVLEGPYGNALLVTERSNTWCAIDITLMEWDNPLLNFEESDYTIVVRGRNASENPITFVIGAMDSPWNWLTSVSVEPGEEFTLETVLSLEAFEAAGGADQFLQRGFRLNTNCTNDYVIYEIEITRN